jgi:NitT/TauT family transport system ATP-binding protein
MRTYAIWWLLGTTLEVVDLDFRYENGYKVFQDINLKAEKGKFIAIVGPSGVGKSTLLRLLGAFLKPEKGSVLLHGKPVLRPTPLISMVHQSIVTFPWMTAEENVALSVRMKNLPKDKVKEISSRALEMVGLQGFNDLYPKEMSGGMRQRVAVARSLAADPKILLMDEPFAHLDELTAEGLRQDIYNILFNEESPLETVIMVSHNLTEVIELSDTVFILNGNPATIVAKVDIDIPRPRSPRDPKFDQMLDILYSYLTKKGVKKE